MSQLPEDDQRAYLDDFDGPGEDQQMDCDHREPQEKESDQDMKASVASYDGFNMEEAYEKCSSYRYNLSQTVKPDFQVFFSSKPPHYELFQWFVKEKYDGFFEYGTMLRSGLEIRCVYKSVNGKDVPTLGVFATCDIPRNAFVTTYGGVIRDRSCFHSLADKSHAIRIPYGPYAEDGKQYAELFLRPVQPGVPSYPCLDPSNPYMYEYLGRGIGFMMNHASRRFANCTLRYVEPSFSLECHGHLPIPIFTSKREIKRDEELTWYYNNYESYSFTSTKDLHYVASESDSD
jgi:hypothetical protein